jgi:hypothetical protein
VFTQAKPVIMLKICIEHFSYQELGEIAAPLVLGEHEKSKAQRSTETNAERPCVMSEIPDVLSIESLASQYAF